MKRQLILATLLSLVVTSGVLFAREKPVMVKDAADSKSSVPSDLFGVAQVETTWGTHPGQ